MGQRARILSEILGVDGWRVVGAYFEWQDGTRADVAPSIWDLGVRISAQLVLVVERRWKARCPDCFAVCEEHGTTKSRRWRDLSWGEHQTFIEATPVRVICTRCDATPVELLPWADAHQRETHRFQNRVAFQAASMPVTHVAALHGVCWSAVRRMEKAALERWQKTRPKVPIQQLGIDEKYLGRRHKSVYLDPGDKRADKWVTIISNNETGEPIEIRFGKDGAAVTEWLKTLSKKEKEGIDLCVMDMSEAFRSAIRNDSILGQKPIVHDAFHLMKRANQVIDEIRRETFFRASEEMRAIGRGKRFLLYKAWERTSDKEREQLRLLFSCNKQLARAYQIVEELRGVLQAPNRTAMTLGLNRILLRTQRRDNKPLRKLHESLLAHWNELIALAEHRPATGRVEALNNNWETLVRRSRGCRDLRYLLLKLQFMIANPIHTERDYQRFQALGMLPPLRAPARRRQTRRRARQATTQAMA